MLTNSLIPVKQTSHFEVDELNAANRCVLFGLWDVLERFELGGNI